MPGMESRHQRAAGRRTNSAARVMIRELHPLFRQAVHVRCLELLLPVTAQIPVTRVIEHDVDDVRFPAGSECGLHQSANQQRDKKELSVLLHKSSRASVTVAIPTSTRMLFSPTPLPTRSRLSIVKRFASY